MSVPRSVVDSDLGAPPIARHPHQLPLSELAVANRQRDALYLLSEQLHQADSAGEIHLAAMEAIEEKCPD